MGSSVEGIVPGESCPFKIVILDELKLMMSKLALNNAKTLEEPIRQIARNAGVESSIVVIKMFEIKKVIADMNANMMVC